MTRPNKRYVVRLEGEEQVRLQRMVSAGSGAARKLTDARILLQADQSADGPGWTDERIGEALDNLNTHALASRRTRHSIRSRPGD